jgi:hypothetical protein
VMALNIICIDGGVRLELVHETCPESQEPSGLFELDQLLVRPLACLLIARRQGRMQALEQSEATTMILF